jgi:superfamily II DNA/RNA helicase
MKNFNDTRIPEALFHRLQQMGFITPTPIQAEALPKALDGQDILGSAQTGTGKTGAFGIPLVTHLMHNDRGTALVLLPTRELALQVLQTLKKFIGSSKLNSALLIGGEPMPPQLRQLKARPRLIVGTPGRVNDHLTRGSLMLHDTNFLVLDEVDRMLDMGFGIQLDAIARYLTAQRQTLMFSATMPKNIEGLANKYLTNPTRISIGAVHTPAANVTQENIKLSETDKEQRLLHELDNLEGSIVVFIKTKYAADRMALKLKKLGHDTEALHGDLRQNKRTRVIENFRKNKYRILVATDVAARGLDIPHIKYVINYDLPQSPEDYIHRIGRTARAGAEGTAINFLTASDNRKWRAIYQLLNPGEKFTDFLDGNERKGRKKPSDGRRKKFGNKPDFKKGQKPSGSKNSQQRDVKKRHDRPSKPKSTGKPDFKRRDDRPAAKKPAEKPKSFGLSRKKSAQAKGKTFSQKKVRALV